MGAERLERAALRLMRCRRMRAHGHRAVQRLVARARAGDVNPDLAALVADALEGAAQAVDDAEAATRRARRQPWRGW